jgi:Iap family predicted aminopeptidase
MLSKIKTIILCTIGSCFSFGQESTNNIAEIISEVNIDSLVKYVNYLSGVEPVVINNKRHVILSRHKKYPGNEIAALFIERTLQDFGLNTEAQQFSVTGKNIIAIQKGLTFPEKKFILCAHYDSMPESAISPGADDNASGVAVVLEAARIFSDYTTDYSIEYALWDEEEQWLIGSYNYLKNEMNNNSGEIIGVINIDMVGWDGNDDNIVLVNSRTIGSSMELANQVIDVNTNYSIDLNPQIIVPGYGSDNMAFWDYGIGSIGIEEHFGVDWNPYYHTSYDNISQFNIPYFHKNAKLSIGVLAKCVNIINQSLSTDDKEITTEYGLQNNYPNPFNANTTIVYSIPNESIVTITIYDMLGKEIKQLISQKQPSGRHSIQWNGADLDGNKASAGIYLYRIQAGQFVQTRKMILLK